MARTFEPFLLESLVGKLTQTTGLVIHVHTSIHLVSSIITLHQEEHV